MKIDKVVNVTIEDPSVQLAMAEIIFRTMLNPFWFLQHPRHTSFVCLIVCFFICLIPSLVTILSKLGPSASEGPPRFY